MTENKHRGFMHERTAQAHNALEKAFADEWEKENDPQRSIEFGTATPAPDIVLEDAGYCANPRCIRGIEIVRNDGGRTMTVAGMKFCLVCAGAAITAAMAEVRWLRELQQATVEDVKETYDTASLTGTYRSIMDDALEATAELLRDFTIDQMAMAQLKLMAVMLARGETLLSVIHRAAEILEMEKPSPLPSKADIEKILGKATTHEKLSAAINKIRRLHPSFRVNIEKHGPLANNVCYQFKVTVTVEPDGAQHEAKENK